MDFHIGLAELINYKEKVVQKENVIIIEVIQKVLNLSEKIYNEIQSVEIVRNIWDGKDQEIAMYYRIGLVLVVNDNGYIFKEGVDVEIKINEPVKVKGFRFKDIILIKKIEVRNLIETLMARSNIWTSKVTIVPYFWEKEKNEDKNKVFLVDLGLWVRVSVLFLVNFEKVNSTAILN